MQSFYPFCGVETQVLTLMVVLDGLSEKSSTRGGGHISSAYVSCMT